MPTPTVNDPNLCQEVRTTAYLEVKQYIPENTPILNNELLKKEARNSVPIYQKIQCNVSEKCNPDLRPEKDRLKKY